MNPAVAIDIDSDSYLPASEYERISYPNNYHWPEQHQELPLHYMSEETARRRLKPTVGEPYGSPVQKESFQDYDDEGKDVYNKLKSVSTRVGSGRPPQRHPLPPTSIVCLPCFFLMASYLPTF